MFIRQKKVARKHPTCFGMHMMLGSHRSSCQHRRCCLEVLFFGSPRIHMSFRATVFSAMIKDDLSQSICIFLLAFSLEALLHNDLLLIACSFLWCSPCPSPSGSLPWSFLTLFHRGLWLHPQRHWRKVASSHGSPNASRSGSPPPWRETWLIRL